MGLADREVESDAFLMGERLVRMGEWGLPVSVVAGRGFDSKAARQKLADKGIENGIAPKDPGKFAES